MRIEKRKSVRLPFLRPVRGQVHVRILNAGIAEMRAIVLFLLCELLVELEEFGYALAFKIHKTCFKINKFGIF
jgi:hypothetical protein